MSEDDTKLTLRDFYKYNRPPFLNYLSICFIEKFSKDEEIQEFIREIKDE
jgi:hypothetical protein